MSVDWVEVDRAHRAAMLGTTYRIRDDEKQAVAALLEARGIPRTIAAKTVHMQETPNRTNTRSTT